MSYQVEVVYTVPVTRKTELFFDQLPSEEDILKALSSFESKALIVGWVLHETSISVTHSEEPESEAEEEPEQESTEKEED